MSVRMTKTNSKYVESWTVSWKDGGMSRSKAIENHDDAVKFKGLVEDAGEVMPPIAVLDENDLLQYADWVHPGVLVQMRNLLSSSSGNAEIVKNLRAVLDMVLDVPR